MFDLLLPQAPLRALRLSEIYLLFSLAEAQRPQRTSMCILFLPRTPLRTLRLGESLFVFFSQRRIGVALVVSSHDTEHFGALTDNLVQTSEVGVHRFCTSGNVTPAHYS